MRLGTPLKNRMLRDRSGEVDVTRALAAHLLAPLTSTPQRSQMMPL